MKKATEFSSLLILFLLFITILCMFGCTAETREEYISYSAVDNEELGCMELHNEGIIYRPYGVFTSNKSTKSNKFKGKQIGVREDAADLKIHEVKGYDSNEWIVEYLDVLMGGNMIFKAVGVNEIPEELGQYKQYDY